MTLTVDRLGEGVVVAVADAANGRLDPGFRHALGVADRQILVASVAVVDQPAAMHGPPLVQRLFQRVEYEAGVRRA